MPGGANYACHECLAWHHTACWAEHGSCSGCGNDWQKDSSSGLTWNTKKETVLPTPGGLANQTFVLNNRLYMRVDGKAVEVTAGNESPPRAKNSAFLDLVGTVNKLLRNGADPEDVSVHDQKAVKLEKAVSDGWKLLAPERSPLLPCQHRFNPEDYKCIHCQKDAREHSREILGFACPSDKVILETVQRGWDRNQDFIKEKFQAKQRADARAKSKSDESFRLFWTVLLVVTGFIAAMIERFLN